MLVIGGAPAVAAAQPCIPCPPDCAVMKDMAAAAADHQGQAPDKGGPAADPCKQDLACQAAFATPVLAQPASTVVLTADVAEHPQFDPLAAPSRPPDRSLRPPIQL